MLIFVKKQTNTLNIIFNVLKNYKKKVYKKSVKPPILLKKI